MLVLAGVGYFVDGFATVLDLDAAVPIPAFVGKAVLIFWLLIRVVRLPDRQDPERAADGG